MQASKDNSVLIVLLVDISNNVDRRILYQNLNKLMNEQAQMESQFTKLTILGFNSHLIALRPIQNVKNCVHFDEYVDAGYYPEDRSDLGEALKRAERIIDENSGPGSNIILVIVSSDKPNKSELTKTIKLSSLQQRNVHCTYIGVNNDGKYWHKIFKENRLNLESMPSDDLEHCFELANKFIKDCREDLNN